MTTEQKQYCSIRTAAEITELGRSSIYNLLRAGRLRAIKIGKRTIIPMTGPGSIAALGEPETIVPPPKARK